MKDMERENESGRMRMIENEFGIWIERKGELNITI